MRLCSSIYFLVPISETEFKKEKERIASLNQLGRIETEEDGTITIKAPEDFVEPKVAKTDREAVDINKTNEAGNIKVSKLPYIKQQ